MQVGQRALKPVADLDAHLPVVAGNQQQDAVVLAALAERPGAKQPVGVGLDGLAAEIGNGRDDDLVGGLLLEVGEFLDEQRFRRGVDQPGIVDNPAGQRRQVLGDSGEGEKQESEEKQGGEARLTLPLAGRVDPRSGAGWGWSGIEHFASALTRIS